MTTTKFFRPWPQHAALIRERQAQPVVLNGVRYVCTSEAALICGLSASWMRHCAANYPGDGLHTMSNGHVFLRKPRCKTDRRSPLYWREDTLR